MTSHFVTTGQTVSSRSKSGERVELTGALLVPGIAFLSGVACLAAFQPDMMVTSALAVAGMAGSVVAALRSITLGRLTVAERIMQGSVYAALVWLSQMAVTSIAPEAGAFSITLSTFVIFFLAALGECTLTALAAYAAGRVKSALGGPIMAAKIIDNRFFGGAGTLDV